MRATSVGVFLSTRLAATGGQDDPLSFVSLATHAETLGFQSIWVGDSLLARPRPEPLTLLAAIAARTRHCTIGSAVLLPALRHPLTVAHSLATLDRLSSGRLMVGVGAGFAYPGTERELAAVGVPAGERVQRTVETIEIWRKLWTSAVPVSHEGRFWSFRDTAIVPRPQRFGGPPIWMGGNAAAAIRRAGRLADGFLPTSSSPEVFRAAWQGVREAAKACGRPEDAVTPAFLLTLCTGRDGEAARRALRGYMESYYGAPFEAVSAFIGCFAGTSDACAEWIQQFVDAGARHVILRFGSREQLAQLERAAEEILPRLTAGGFTATEAVLRHYCDAWTRGDVPALLELYADDMVLHYFGRNPLAGRHVGKHAVLGVLAAAQQRTRRELVAIDDLLIGAHRAAILVRERFHRDANVAEVERVLVYRVRDGKLAECWLYDHDQRLVDGFLS